MHIAFVFLIWVSALYRSDHRWVLFTSQHHAFLVHYEHQLPLSYSQNREYAGRRESHRGCSNRRNVQPEA